jgi:putative hemolysin
LEHLKEQNSKGAKYALKLLDNSENFLSSIQVGITLIGIITGFYGGISLAKYLTPLFVWMNISPVTSYGISVTISIAIITFLSIVIGELVPKTIALSKPKKQL